MKLVTYDDGRVGKVVEDVVIEHAGSLGHTQRSRRLVEVNP